MRLEQYKFEAWLKAKAPDTIVGRNRNCDSCPIANFYSDSGGGGIIIFERIGDGYFIDRGYDVRKAPAWVSNFIWSADDGEYREITARHALEMLAS
jgi:hypothetical protein